MYQHDELQKRERERERDCGGSLVTHSKGESGRDESTSQSDVTSSDGKMRDEFSQADHDGVTD